MATAAVSQKPSPAPPNYVFDPDAVLKDHGVEWRYGIPPNYTKTRGFFNETKSRNHKPGSLEAIVENLVKNWEIEASFKKRLSDWRTVNHEKYSFAIHGGKPQGAEAMLKIGTYNAIILPNEYYDPATTDFAQSHKTFKRMMPTFAWEVLEVYSAPPRISFRWRHWGVMKNDYVGINNKGEKVTARAHGGEIDITGITIADIDENLQITSLKTYFDSMQMFRQIVRDREVEIERLDTADETVVTTGHSEGVINSAATPSFSDKSSTRSSPKGPKSVEFVLPPEDEIVQRKPSSAQTASDDAAPAQGEKRGSFARMTSKFRLRSKDKKEGGITPDVARDAREAYHVDMPKDKIHPHLQHAEYRGDSSTPGQVPVDHFQGYTSEHAHLDMGSLDIRDCPVMGGSIQAGRAK